MWEYVGLALDSTDPKTEFNSQPPYYKEKKIPTPIENSIARYEWVCACVCVSVHIWMDVMCLEVVYACVKIFRQPPEKIDKISSPSLCFYSVRKLCVTRLTRPALHLQKCSWPSLPKKCTCIYLHLTCTCYFAHKLDYSCVLNTVYPPMDVAFRVSFWGRMCLSHHDRFTSAYRRWEGFVFF